MHCLTQEVLLQRAVALGIVLKSDILFVSRALDIVDLLKTCTYPVRRECTRPVDQLLQSESPLKYNLQDRDVAKNALKRLVQYVAHLVLEVLRRHERIEEITPI